MRRAWLWGPVVAQMLVIFVASSIPNLQTLPGGISDKLGHSVGYGILGLLLVRALAGGRARGVTWAVAALSIVIATAYGCTDEFHQRFVPGRSPDPMDIVADARGATIAAVGAYSTLLIPAVRRRFS